MTAPARAPEPEPETDLEPRPDPGRRSPVSRLREAGRTASGWWHYALAAGVALAAALWTYRPWTLGTATPYPNGDALAVLSWATNVQETGWYEAGTRLAAPFSANVHPFTVTDELYFALVKLLLPVTGDPATAVTWLLLLSFPAAALTATLLARHLRLSKVASALVGIAFAVHIDHFIRGLGHFQLAATWVIPIGVLAAVSLVHGPRHVGRRRVAWEVALLVGLLAVGFTSAYYAVFTGVLVAAAGVLTAWSRRSRDTLLLTGLRGAALTVPVLVGVLLDKLYLPAQLGYEAVAVTRGQADAEIYGGKITAMLLPSEFHRFGPLAQLRSTYDSVFPNKAEGPSLGLIATIGFVGLVCWAVARYWRPQAISREPVLATLAGLTWVSLFVYVTGGLGTIWSLVLDGGGLRVWSRMHMVLMLLAVLAVAVVIDRLRPPWRAVVAAAVALVALVDGTSPVFRPNAPAAVALEDEVRALTSEIAATSGPQAAVFQYPAVTFPVPDRDTSPGSIYDGFLPYVYSDDLRWSYGGMQGDPASDWQQTLPEYPLATRVALLRAAGFAGILVDTWWLATTPDERDDVLDLLGTPDVTSTSGRWLFFDLGEVAGCDPAALATAGDLAVRPVLAYPGEGLELRGPGGGANSEGTGEVRLVTLRDEGWPSVTVTFRLDTQAPLRLELPDGTTQELAPGEHRVRWTGAAQADDVVRITRTAGPGAYAVSSLDADVEVDDDVRACLDALRPAG